MFCLDNQVALVTGASGSIGRQIAKMLHRQGAILAISGTKEAILKDLAEELGGRTHIFPCNLGNNEEIDTLIPHIEKELGKIDILVNNAGLTRDGLLIRMKDADWNDVIQVNLTSAFRLCRSVAKGMMRRQYGRIINISSIVGFSGNPGQANYVASKAGLVGLSKSLALELSTRGITVNCVAPGFIGSAMTEELPQKVKETILGTIPMKRMGTADEIASCVLFLASTESSYITGQTIHANGGMMCL